DATSSSYPILGPIFIPPHAAAQERHLSINTAGYTANGLYRLIRTTLKSLAKANSDTFAFTESEIDVLLTTTPHGFRHTFGTLAVASGMPLDVAQAVLGHASVGTTGIYVQSKKKRMLEESTKFFELNSNED
ncbi:MAG: site-specific integrase, partial [Methanoregula sp.]|nr:site-specific integrase [Methanoregula sp.]